MRSMCTIVTNGRGPGHVYVIYKKRGEMINDVAPGVCPPTFQTDASRLR